MDPLKLDNLAVITLLGLPDEALIRQTLESKGWSRWCGDNYWVHPKRVANPKAQDHTNYGLPLPAAYVCEIEGWPPSPGLLGLPSQSCPEDSLLYELQWLAEQAGVWKNIGLEYVFPFGKHKGEKAGAVARSDPGYVLWCHKKMKGFHCNDELYGLAVRSPAKPWKRPIEGSPAR